jgi:hypothetical protein
MFLAASCSTATTSWPVANPVVARWISWARIAATRAWIRPTRALARSHRFDGSRRVFDGGEHDAQQDHLGARVAALAQVFDGLPEGVAGQAEHLVDDLQALVVGGQVG